MRQAGAGTLGTQRSCTSICPQATRAIEEMRWAHKSQDDTDKAELLGQLLELEPRKRRLPGGCLSPTLKAGKGRDGGCREGEAGKGSPI